MDLRAGSPAAERRTRSRSFRGTILPSPTPSCAHDDDRVRLPPASPPRNSKAGKKESTGRRPSRLCQPCATPSSNSSLDYRRGDARIAENGFATSSGVNKSAKVVLVIFGIILDGIVARVFNARKMRSRVLVKLNMKMGPEHAVRTQAAIPVQLATIARARPIAGSVVE